MPLSRLCPPDKCNRVDKQVADSEAKFILLLNDNPEIRHVFAALKIRSVATRYSLGAAADWPVPKLLIRN